VVRQNPEDLERVVKVLMGQPRGGILLGATWLERVVRAVESLPDDEKREVIDRAVADLRLEGE
jgi:hypothetical protein